ncbi:MAG: ribonuclease Y [Parachlamydiaceae bacterium]|nr:ribonuclease Y [Parachlamydiaceae bacterium]
MSLDDVAYLLLILISGAALGAVAYWFFHRMKVGSYQSLVNGMMHKAEIETESVRKSAELTMKQQQVEQQRELERLWQVERRKMQREEERLKLREDKLETRMNTVEGKLTDIERREEVLAIGKSKIEEEKRQTAELQHQLVLELEKVSGLSSAEAKDLIINRLTNDVKTDAANLVRKIKKEAEENAEREASTIIATAINRMAGSCVSEITLSTVAIPNEEMKGRVIGREGRNIKALERATGVNFIIDDTPGVVVISGFDPVRMHIAKVALADLLTDGRIHPTRIEEVVEKTTANVHKQIKAYGEDAALRGGAMNLHPELIILLGKLKFRYSYGQNILDHSLEVSHLLGMMAAELGLNQQLAKRIGLLHDIGKAVTHEIEGSHAIIGYDFAIKYGESKEVANGIGCHHQEMDAITIEGSLCSAADSLSASRPGARIEAVEEYVKRLKRLEDLAYEFKGVEKAYAMQAGREIRIIVTPDLLDDAGTVALAHDLTKRIEEELRYPGKIKVTVIREKRVVEYAL